MNQPLSGGFFFDTLVVIDRGPRSAPRETHVLPWVIVAVNVLFLAWMMFGVSSVASSTCTSSMTQLACDAARAGSSSLGALMAGLIWAAVDVILGGIWLATNRSAGSRTQSSN